MSIQWSLVLFTALTGVAGWMFACVAVDEFWGKTKQTGFMASAVALVLAVIGGLASVTHLAHPENIMGVFGHPTEGIFLEALLVGLMCLFGIVYLVMLNKGSSASARRALAVLAAVFGIVLSFAAGKSYMMAAIPAWDTFLLPCGYLGTAVPGGVAAYLVVAALQKEEAEALKPYGTLLLCAGILAAVTSLLYFAVGAPGQLGVGIATVLLAGAVPAFCGFMVSRKPGKTLLYAGLALACALVGIVCYRAAMWLAYDKGIDLFGLGL